MNISIILLMVLGNWNGCNDKVILELPLFYSESCDETAEYNKLKDCANIQYLLTKSRSLQYPEEAKSEGIEGTVLMKHKIDEDGYPFDFEIMRGLGYGCDEEALRILNEFEYFPAINECGDPVESHLIHRIKFEL